MKIKKKICLWPCYLSINSGPHAKPYGGGAYGVSIAGASSKASMTGSLSSIVHSEDEIAGSYNWDYLLDWGPQYQPLAHVFKEISKLR